MFRQTSIVYSFTAEGWHRWASAPLRCDYLRARHHHYFTFQITVEVKHGDRELEIIEAAREGRELMQRLFDEGVFELSSCEHIAETALQLIPLEEDGSPRDCEIVVLEDGLQGAKLVHRREVR